MDLFYEEVAEVLPEELDQLYSDMSRGALLVGGATAAIEKFYFEEDMQQALMSGAAAAGSTILADYVGSATGFNGRGANLLVSSGIYTFAGPMIVESLNNKSPMERFFTSVAGHVGAGVVGRVVGGGTVASFANSVSAYSPSLGGMMGP